MDHTWLRKIIIYNNYNKEKQNVMVNCNVIIVKIYYYVMCNYV